MKKSIKSTAQHRSLLIALFCLDFLMIWHAGGRECQWIGMLAACCLLACMFDLLSAFLRQKRVTFSARSCHECCTTPASIICLECKSDYCQVCFSWMSDLVCAKFCAVLLQICSKEIHSLRVFRSHTLTLFPLDSVLCIVQSLVMLTFCIRTLHRWIKRTRHARARVRALLRLSGFLQRSSLACPLRTRSRDRDPMCFLGLDVIVSSLFRIAKFQQRQRQISNNFNHVTAILCAVWGYLVALCLICTR